MVEQFVPTAEQEAVIDSTSATLIVQACAGAGKTATLAARVARLVAEGDRPLAVTTTRQARSVIRAALPADLPAAITPCTLHALARRVVASAVPTPAWSVGDRRALARALGQPRTVAAQVEALEAAALCGTDLPAAAITTGALEAWDATRSAAQSSSAGGTTALSWTELLLVAAAALDAGRASVPGISDLVVDESQDVSVAGWVFIDALRRATGCHVTAAGDGGQKIFGFAGVGAGLTDVIPTREAELLSLTTCFRCPSTVCGAASAIIGRPVVPRPGAPEGAITTCSPADLAGLLAPGDAVLGLTRQTVERALAGVDAGRWVRRSWRREGPRPGAIWAATVHAAKGWTLGRVFIVGASAQPGSWQTFWPVDPAQARRLAYVAVTRSTARVTWVVRGRTPPFPAAPSPLPVSRSAVKVSRVTGCRQPVTRRLGAGRMAVARCWSRDPGVCPACAALSREAVRRLFASGLETPGAAAWWFVTLTPPSFGRVGGDGAPADPARYSVSAQARWNAAFGQLASATLRRLRRALPGAEYASAREWQRRRSPHLHVLVRVGGALDPAAVGRVLLGLRNTSRQVSVGMPPVPVAVGWGRQATARPVEGDGPLLAQRLAACASYASKGASGASRHPASPARLDADGRLRGVCARLGLEAEAFGVPQAAAFTASRGWGLTLRAIRDALQTEGGTDDVITAALRAADREAATAAMTARGWTPGRADRVHGRMLLDQISVV